VPLDQYRWGHLNRIQIGNYAEYLVKMEFVLCGADVFTSEVDDHGIDLVIRTATGDHYDIQVKSAYRASTGYVYLYRTHPRLFLALVRFIDGQPPELYLIPSCLQDGTRNPILKQCWYTAEGKREFEWGLALNKKNLTELARNFKFGKVVAGLIVQPQAQKFLKRRQFNLGAMKGGPAVGDLEGLIGNAHDFYRAWGVARHVFRDAAKQETLHAFSPVGTQNDEICT